MMITSSDLNAERRRLYALLGLARRELSTSQPQWGEDSYRMILRLYGAQPVNGRPSAATLSIRQLEKVLAHLRSLDTRPHAVDWRAPRITKLNALWCQLADAGHIMDRSERAMQNWCRRELPGLEKLAWADSIQLNRVVEMLKLYCRRCGIQVD